MIDKPILKDAVIVQQAYQIGPFADMLRLSYHRHSAYAWAHGMEYWPLSATLKPELWPGGWGKIWAIRLMMEVGYKYVFHIDTDAVIADMDCDLRDGLPEGKLIGAVEHWAPDWFPQWDIPRHYNVGVMFFRNDPLTIEFLDDWIGRFPGHQRWFEQGAFNEMVKEEKYSGIFHHMDDKWNATYNVNLVENPCIIGWHGIMPEAKRLAFLKDYVKDDFQRFRL